MDNFADLALRTEEAISESIKKTQANAWDENHLTFKWLDAITQLLDGQTVLEPGQTRRIACSAFKLKGKLEQEHGDVAVIVNLAFEDGDELEGVGFLEAKRRDRYGTGFPALDVKQLKRLYKGTDYAKVLLYDWAPVIPGAVVDSPYDSPYETHAIVIPMDSMLDGKRANRNAYRLGVSLSHQLVYRYLQGLDLSLQTKALAAARGFATKELISTSVLSIGVGVGAGNLPPPHVKPPDLEQYALLTEQRRP
jgi:hypothetical protein